MSKRVAFIAGNVLLITNLYIEKLRELNQLSKVKLVRMIDESYTYGISLNNSPLFTKIQAIKISVK